MTVKWGSCIFLFGFLALLVGCRTPQPDLKPKKEPEELRPPPPDGRYSTPEYPKEAFNKSDDDGTKRSIDKGAPPPGGMRGASSSSMGAGGPR